MKDKNNHKKLFICLGVLLVLLIGGAIAYYSTLDSIDNIFHTKEYSSKSIEEFTSPNNWKPGDTTPKSIVVENNGDMCEDVRIFYTERWISKNGEELPTSQNGLPLVNVKLSNKVDWVKDGNYFYYNKTLQPGDKTSSFLKSVTYSTNALNDYDCTNEVDKFICKSSGNGYDGATYTLTIHIETMYCATSADAWGVDVNALNSPFATFDEGEVVNDKILRLANNGLGLYDLDNGDTEYYDENITAILKADQLPNGFSASSSNTLSSSSSVYPIYAWYDNNIIYYYSEADTISLNEVSNNMFSFLRNLSSIEGISSWDTSNVINMNCMFQEAGHSAQSFNIDLSNWDTSEVTNMSYMFAGSGLEATSWHIGDLSSWDTSKVTDMGYMFSECNLLRDLISFSNWDTSEVTIMTDMFNGCDGLTSLTGISSWDTSKVESMHRMFDNCRNLTDASAINGWNISSVSFSANTLEGNGFYYMFNHCPAHPTFINRTGTWDSHNSFVPNI